jgi:hypothetical protein
MLMRRLLGLLALTLLGGALLLPAAAGAAERCHQQAVRGPDGSIHYVQVCVDVDPGDPGTPGDGQPEDCGQDEVTPGPGDGPYFCSGGIPCAYTTNVVPLALPTTEPPPGQEWKVLICQHGGFFTKDWVLTNGTQPRPLIVQAQEAFGNLAPPAGAVRHSPDTRGIVGLPTWLWLDPASFGVLHGSSAEGLVAVAEPRDTDWATGDGGSVSCTGAGTPYGTGGTGCTHTYRAASARYDGTVTRHWQVHYENGGTPIDIPGAPLQLTAETPWTLGVAEAQVVTGGR